MRTVKKLSLKELPISLPTQSFTTQSYDVIRLSIKRAKSNNIYLALPLIRYIIFSCIASFSDVFTIFLKSSADLRGQQYIIDNTLSRKFKA